MEDSSFILFVPLFFFGQLADSSLVKHSGIDFDPF